MRERASWVVRFWESDRSLSFLLLFLAMVIFLITPLAQTARREWLLEVAFPFILASGVWALAKRRRTALLVGIIALANVLVRWARYILPALSLQVADTTLSLLALGLMVVLVAAQVFREGPITMHRVQGAVAVYLLLGFIWATAYVLIELLAPGAFTIDLAERQPLMPKMLYFSFVTLTTTGYGDVTAVHPVAQSLALLEALVGQLFPAILIARLVSMEVEHSRRSKRGD